MTPCVFSMIDHHNSVSPTYNAIVCIHHWDLCAGEDIPLVLTVQLHGGPVGKRAHCSLNCMKMSELLNFMAKDYFVLERWGALKWYMG